MKNFIIFLIVCMVILGGFIYYQMQHPSDTMIVRQGAHWVMFEHNVTDRGAKK